MRDINELVKQILNDKADLKELCSSLKDDMGYFETEYEGKLDSESLSLVIDKAFRIKDLQFILGGLLYCSGKDSVTDEIFNKLLKFRLGLRKTYMGALGHCDISFYQLMKINKLQVGFEAFGWLMRHMYTSDVFSAEDILQLLKDSEYIKSTWKDTFEDLLSLENRASAIKRELIANLSKQHPIADKW